MECIFCKIASKDQSADIVYEDERVIAFRDMHPKAPVHILIVPKRHIASIKDMKQGDKEIMGELLFLASRLAKSQNIDEGYKLMFNVGREGGQIIDHVHLHLMGGWK